MRAIFLAAVAALATGETAAAETLDWRRSCDRWEHVPASETLGSPASALLFCTREDGSTWLALRVDCLSEPVRMAMHYQPGFRFEPPVREAPPASEPGAADAELSEALRVIARIPYEDSGIRVRSPEEIAAGHEMVYVDFQSFGYTGIAEPDGAGTWVFAEPEPLSPVFSRLMSGAHVDIRLLSSGVTERFPLRGSGKALRPVVESCRLAKRDEDR